MVVRGEVVSFDRIKGYGFVSPEVGGEDVFLHVNDLLDDKSLLGPGSIVEFQVTEGDRGPKASSVTIVKPAPGAASTASAARQVHLSANSNADDMCDVLSVEEFEHEFTELLLRAEPALTGPQILGLREKIKTIAQGHGWVDA